MSLRRLAESKQLPDIQEMDFETVLWIKNTGNKYFNDTRQLVISPISTFNGLEYLPKIDWFLNKELFYSLHGIRHISRVLIYSNVLTSYFNISTKVMNELCLAVSLHDIRRINDKSDKGHGDRAALWFLENREEVFYQFKVEGNYIDADGVAAAIRFHEKPLNLIPHLSTSHQDILNWIKLVDSLDRFRLPDHSWWLNQKYLAVTAPEDLIKFAFLLVLESEKYFLKNDFNFSKLKAIAKDITISHGRNT